jgi:uncharacterized protein
MNEKLMRHLENFEDKYPRGLEASYPRIIERIVQLWDSPEMASYFSELLIDKRGGRQGFPSQIASEIFLLSVTHDEIKAKKSEKGDTWDQEREEAKRELEHLNLKFVPEQLLKATEFGDPARVVLFLRAGMAVDTRDERDWTPLMVAAFNGNEAVAKLLVQHGANVGARDRGGYSPLHWAALNGYKEVVRLLIDKGADRNAQSNFGWTSLMQAATKGHAVIAGMLIEAGADPNMASNDGWTPLHKAVANGHKATIAVLLGADASILARHQDGSTPLSIAEKSKYPAVLDMIRSKLEKPSDV